MRWLRRLKMRRPDPVVLFDLSEIEAFPPYGENRSELDVAGPCACLTVYYGQC